MANINRIQNDDEEPARDHPFKIEEWTYDPLSGDMTNKVTGEVVDGDTFNQRVIEAKEGESGPAEDDDYSQVARPKGRGR